MSQFRYIAKQGPAGKPQTGTIEARDYREAVSLILRKGGTPIEIIPVSFLPASHAPSSAPVKKKNLFAAAPSSFFQSDIVFFTRYLADFLSAEVPLLRSLELMQGYFQKGRLAVVLPEIIGQVRDGASLSEALGRFPELFSALYRNMIRAGEASGALSAVVGRLADFLERDRELRVGLAMNLIYPLVILVTACMTIFVLLTWVIPRIVVIFEDMNQKLPLVTRILMAISSVFAKWWWLLIAGTAAAVVLGWRWYKTKEGRAYADRLATRCPWVGELIRQVALARFARTLSTLIDGGVDIVAALNYASQVIGNDYYHTQLIDAAGQVAAGDGLGAVLRRCTLFTEPDTSMLSVGEETGTLSLGLAKLAEFYEKNSRQTMRVITTLIEPGLILMLGLLVGFIVLALLMPVFNMNLVVH
ncbi:MAG TPA: type II secretion system F family protein [Candidatus Bathyarchaeia archaeon]|nr:type II secretion system F family protein [Candidatus Bathyarchaeia archaeon]